MRGKGNGDFFPAKEKDAKVIIRWNNKNQVKNKDTLSDDDDDDDDDNFPEDLRGSTSRPPMVSKSRKRILPTII